MLIADEQLHRGKWHLGIVIEPISGNNGLLRSAKVKFDGTIKTRFVVKQYFLLTLSPFCCNAYDLFVGDIFLLRRECTD